MIAPRIDFKGMFFKLILPLMICLIVIPLTGVYFDYYEGLFACFISGDFFSPITDKEIDLHYLLLPLYARLNALFPTIFVYGYILVIFTLFILIYAYNIALRYLKGSAHPMRYGLLLLIIFALVCFSKLITIKITIIFAGALMADILDQQSPERNKVFSYIKLISFSIFICLMRLDIAILLSLFLCLSSVLTLRHAKQSFVFCLVTSSLFLSHKVLLSKTTDAKKIFFYKEYELFDREILNQDSLSENETMSLNMLRFLSISDTLVYNIEFIGKVTNHKGSLMSSYLSNTNVSSALNALKKSSEAFLKTFPYLLTTLFSLLILLFNIKSVRKRLIFVLLSLFPLLISLLSAIPDRFLIAYYITLTAATILSFLRKQPLMAGLCILLLLFAAVADTIMNVRQNKYDQRVYQQNMDLLAQLHASGVSPVIESMEYQFFPKSIFSERPSNDAPFMNAYMFNSYEAYISKWHSMGVSNPLSLKEKMTHIAKNNMSLLMEAYRVEVYQTYFVKYYGINIEFIEQKSFNNHLREYKVAIANHDNEVYHDL